MQQSDWLSAVLVGKFEQEGKMDAFHGSSNISCFTAMSGILELWTRSL